MGDQLRGQSVNPPLPDSEERAFAANATKAANDGLKAAGRKEQVLITHSTIAGRDYELSIDGKQVGTLHATRGNAGDSTHYSFSTGAKEQRTYGSIGGTIRDSALGDIIDKGINDANKGFQPRSEDNKPRPRAVAAPAAP